MTNFWKDKKILVTGANGFLGAYATQELVKRGAKVTAVLSPSKKPLSPILRKIQSDITLVSADLLDFTACLSLVSQQEIILHFAAMDGNQVFKQTHAKEIFETNIALTRNMLKAAKQNHIQRFLLMSSIEIYPKDLSFPWVEEKVNSLQETMPIGYAKAKLFSEELAKEYFKKYSLPITIIRMGNIYGPFDHNERVIPTFITKIKKGEKITFVGDGLQKKSFLYISDAIDALLQLVAIYPKADPVNIVSEQYISIKDLADIISHMIQMDGNTKLSLEKGQNLISVEKAKKIIQFSEKKDLIKGLQQTIISMT